MAVGAMLSSRFDVSISRHADAVPMPPLNEASAGSHEMSPAAAKTGSPLAGGGGGGAGAAVVVEDGGAVVVVVSAWVSTTSCGATEAPASRLEYAVWVALADVTARLIVPAALTSGVMSAVAHEPLVTAPDVATVAPGTGAFDHVMVDSDHDVEPSDDTE